MEPKPQQILPPPEPVTPKEAWLLNERRRRKATAAGIFAAMTAFHEDAQSLGFLEQGQNKKSPATPLSWNQGNLLQTAVISVELAATCMLAGWRPENHKYRA